MKDRAARAAALLWARMTDDFGRVRPCAERTIASALAEFANSEIDYREQLQKENDWEDSCMAIDTEKSDLRDP